MSLQISAFCISHVALRTIVCGKRYNGSSVCLRQVIVYHMLLQEFPGGDGNFASPASEWTDGRFRQTSLINV